MRATLRRLWVNHRSVESRWARRITAAATVLFLFAVCNWRPWELFARGGFSADFYDAQARAFLHGRLDVSADIAGPEGFLIDGKTYLYYGPLLALARMPFALFGHWADGRLSRLSLTAGFFTACTLSRHVVTAMAAALGSRAGSKRQAVLTAAVAVSPALSLAGWNTVYHETEMWAFALFLATTVAALRLWVTPSRRATIVASGCAVATVLTRTSVGFGALGALGLVGVLLWRRHRPAATASLGAMVTGVGLSMAVNLAKFGSLVDLPADRQVLSLQNSVRAEWFAGNNGSFFSLRFLPTTLAQYLRPDTVRFERLVPFIRFGPLAPNYGSYPAETITPSASLPTAATLLCLLAVVGLVITVRRRLAVVGALFLGAIVAAVPSFLIGFVAQRYLVDMLPALILPAAVTVVCVPAPRRLSARQHTVLLTTIAIWGLLVNIALGVWIQNLKEPGFTALRYRIDDALFDGPPPSVVKMPADGQVPRDGVVAIDGSCDGLYIAEQLHWVALELADGTRRVEGHIDATDPTVRISTPDGVLDLSISATGAVAGFTQPDGTRTQGEAVTASPTDRIVVESDPITGRFVVTIGGRLAFFMFDAPDLSEATFSAAWVRFAPEDQGTPICRRLQERALSTGLGGQADR